ncbi:MAG: spore germination protein [Firmicutes bacterium]|nr:spore germination protein [Bacillota bacterium]
MLRMRKKEKQIGNSGSQTPRTPNQPLSKSVNENLKSLEIIFNNCSDVVFREFLLAQKEQIKLALVYIEGLTDKTQVSEEIMKALSLEVPMATSNTEITKANALHYVKMRGLCIHQVQETRNITDVVNAILSGNTILLVDGHDTAIINSTQGWEKRSIEESKTEIIVRGPRESFVETLRTNTSMLRRKIKNPDLKIETMELGEKTHTKIALFYVAGIVNEGLVEEARKRLSRIKIDGILESGYIEELISDNAYTPFPTMAHTDRPDRVAAYLLEGRIAIMVEGTPVVLTAPSVFMEAIQTPEDYYERSIFMSAIRGLRILGMLLALTLPSLYVAIISFHHEMLPTPLLLSIAAQREAVPLPVFVEVLFMEVAFEIIREAGIRLPRPVGQAVSIVAALIIGEAAVSAGMVAGATIIVVALTAMASFTVYYSGSIAFRMLRFPLIFLAGSMGLFGLISGIIVMVVHMASLRSFGVPYLEPFAPIVPGDLKDSVVRAPWWAIKKRPHLMGQNDPRRAKPGMKPKPPRKG